VSDRSVLLSDHYELGANEALKWWAWRTVKGQALRAPPVNESERRQRWVIWYTRRSSAGVQVGVG
jgi:hypothetical protein